jgi:RNA polymerase sigma factor (TIGR02999 family)
MIAVMPSVGSLTAQLRLYSSGNREAADFILREALPRLRQIAAWKLANPRFFCSATPTDLIGETWLTRLHGGRWKVESREHFYSMVGKAMEQVLADMARKRLAQRRGKGAIHISLEDVKPSGQPASADAEQILAIQMLVEQLEKENPMNAAIFRAQYFAGLGFDEIAKEAGLTPRQVRNRWDNSKVWLAMRLFPKHPELRKRSPSRG